MSSVNTGIEDVPSENVGMLEPTLGGAAAATGLGACAAGAAEGLTTGFIEGGALERTGDLEAVSFVAFEVDVSAG